MARRWPGGRTGRWVAVAAVGLLLASLAAAELTVTAALDQDAITLDDVAQLTVTLSGSGLENAAEPTVPAVDGLRVVSSSTQQSFSLINGRMQSTFAFVYALQPTRKGTFTIPAISVTSKGRTYRTTPLHLKVAAGTGQASPAPGGGGSMPAMPGMPSMPNPFGPDPTASTVPPGEAAAVRHGVDHKTAYVGEQITYTFGFYQADRISGDLDYRAADTPGFVAESLPNPANTTEQLKGRTYTVQRRQKALFATTPGQHTIGRAVVSVTSDPLLGAQELVADPITVTVRPLPEQGKPANFGGAVGRFEVALKADRQTVRAGETLNLQVQVTGSGNLRSLAPPDLNLPDWARSYPAGADRKVQPGYGGSPTVIGGTGQFNYLVLPRQPGTLKLGPITYSYFDPGAGAYRTATSNSLTVTVTPGAAAAPANDAAIGGGLRPLKTRPGKTIGLPWVLQPWFWALAALPLLAVAWAGWRRWQIVALRAAPHVARAEHALGLVRRRLHEAEQCLANSDTDACLAMTHAALCDYVADRLGAPPAGLTADSACQLLLQAGCRPELAEQTRALIERVAGGRYAPGGSDPQRARATVQECLELAAALQKEVRPNHEPE